MSEISTESPGVEVTPKPAETEEVEAQAPVAEAPEGAEAAEAVQTVQAADAAEAAAVASSDEAESDPAKAEARASEVTPEPAADEVETAPAKADAGAGDPEPGAAESAPRAAKGGKRPAPAAETMAPAVLALLERMKGNELVSGKVIGWNKGGFHVVCESVTAFCPNSEMELGKVRAPKDYLDKSYDFSVLRIEDSGRRVVLSRTKALQEKRTEKRAALRQKIQAGTEIEGKVASLTKFGAFVDLGGVQGLVHVSEISRSRVDDPADVLSVGQSVKVKVLKVEQGGKRISLSMKALEPDPWKSVAERFPEGSVVQGRVERTASFGAFVALEPGLTGLLPASVLNLPRDASISRMYSPGKELSVMVMSVDPRRRRISLALEGSMTEGSRSDFEKFKKSQVKEASSGGFNALAAAFQKIQKQG